MKRANLGEFLKELRVAKGLSQKFVSDKLGYTSAQFVSNWERGVSTPPLTTLKSLSKLYQHKEQELFEMIVQDTLVRTREMLEKQYKQAQRRTKK